MSKITNIKTINDEKLNITLEISQKELLWLKGNMENMHIFSESNLEHITRLVQRGKRDATKYLLLPKELRKNVAPSDAIECNKIETKTKDIFIFAISKY